MKERCKRQAGFTLIEVMVVVVIIGILAGLIVPNVMGRTDQANVTAVKGDLKSIASALEMYRLDNHVYPDTQQGLEALVSRPSPAMVGWNPEGYLRRVPTDPWGRPYLYLSPGIGAAFEVISLGADGAEGGQGTNADLSSKDL